MQELPTFDLQPVGAGRYEAEWDGFNAAGLYQIAIYARDRIGNTAVPELTTVSVDSLIKRKAVIVGGGRQPDPLWETTYRKGLERAYNALRVQGYTDDTIAFRSPVTFNAGVDGAPSLSNIEYLLTTWGTFDTYDLVVYLVGPGSAAGFEINAFDTLTAADLDAWLDIVQHTVPGNVTVVADFTDSGSFLAQLTPPSGKKRITMASTRPGETARFLSNGDLSFSTYFWTSVLNGANVWNAFKHGQIAMRFSGFGQLGAIDDTANGIGNEKLDGVLARNYTIGAGIQLAGDDPVIGSAGVTPTPLTSGTTATIFAEDVTSTGTIAYVTAAITPPGGGAPVEVNLVDVGGGRYEADYTAFDTYGEYAISIVAVDADSNSSLAAEAMLTQSSGPDAYEEDDAVGQATLTGTFGEITRHNFHDTGDTDWLRFYGQASQVISIETLNLEPSCDTEIALYDGVGTLLNDPEGDGNLGQDGNGASLTVFNVPASGYYFVEVRQLEPAYGADTGYDIRVAHNVVGCVASASLTVYVKDNNGAAVSGATVTLSNNFSFSESSPSDGEGKAVFPTLGEDATYFVQAVKTGYSNGFTSQSITCGQASSANVTLNGTSGGAQIGASPGGIEFYYVRMGDSFTKNVIVSNTGTGTLSGSASTAAPFSIVGSAGYSLAAGQSKTIAVRFSPVANQRYEGVLSLTGAGTVQLPLGGRGVDPAQGMVGDVDSSGDINALDATLINLFTLYVEDLDEVYVGTPPQKLLPPGLSFNPAAANVNRDDKGVTGLDATLILLEQLAGRAWLDAQVATNGNARSHSGEPLE